MDGPPLQRGQHPAGEGLPSVPGVEETPLPQDGNDHRQARSAAVHAQPGRGRGRADRGIP